jgi:hypothetical protein
MMSFTKIMRTILGFHTRNVLDLFFKKMPDADFAIVLEEIGYPTGGVRTYAWWKSHQESFFIMYHCAFGKEIVSLDTSRIVNGNMDDFNSIHSFVEQFRYLKDLSSDIRDGGDYCVTWGTKEDQHKVDISNPPAESVHYTFIRQLMEKGWSNGPKSS